MPAITDVSLWDSKAIRELADAEFMARFEKVGVARGYYDGRFPKPLTDDKDNVVLNLCRQVIEETAAFLAPDMPSIELDGVTDKDNPDEVLVNETWANSGGARLINNMAVSGGIAGHVFARVVWDGSTARIVNLSAQHVIRWWLASDHTITMGYELRWSSGKTEYRTDVIRVENMWVVRDMNRVLPDDKKKSGGVVVEQTPGAWMDLVESPWEYPIAPIVDWAHLPSVGGAYGENEIPHADMNLHINKVASDIKSILRYHAYPTTVGTGFTAKDVQETRIDGFLTIPSTDAKVYNVEMESDLVSSMNMLQTLRDSFFNQARVVVVKGGLDTFRGMTNLGIRAAFMPMIAKTAQLRRNYTDGIVAITRLVLMLTGKTSAEDGDKLPVKVVWGDALPTDEREELAVIQQQMMMGVMSKRTAATRLGLNYDKEVSNMQSEAVEENAMINGIGDNV